MYSNSFRTSGRHALTIVEVVVSIALLSTLLVGMLTAYSRHVRQINRADELQIATKYVDALVADWFRDTQPLSDYKSGSLGPESNMYWQMTAKPGGPASLYGGATYELNVFKQGSDPRLVLSLELLGEAPQ